MQRQHLADDNYIVTGSRGKSLLEQRGSRSPQGRGKARGTRSEKSRLLYTPLPPTSPFYPEGLGRLSRNYLVAKMKTSRELSLTRDSIIGTDGCKETLAFSNHHFEPLLFILSEQWSKDQDFKLWSNFFQWQHLAPWQAALGAGPCCGRLSRPATWWGSAKQGTTWASQLLPQAPKDNHTLQGREPLGSRAPGGSAGRRVWRKLAAPKPTAWLICMHLPLAKTLKPAPSGIWRLGVGEAGMTSGQLPATRPAFGERDGVACREASLWSHSLQAIVPQPNTSRQQL